MRRTTNNCQSKIDEANKLQSLKGGTCSDLLMHQRCLQIEDLPNNGLFNLIIIRGVKRGEAPFVTFVSFLKEIILDTKKEELE